MQRPQRRSRLAFDGLVIMLVALAVFAVAAAVTTRSAADTAAQAIVRSAHAAGAPARAADAAVAALENTEQLVLTITSIVSAGTLLLLALAVTILRRDEDRADGVVAAELRRMRQASLTDYLTGLGNHRAYHDDLARNVAECLSDGSVMTVALIDVDGLKVVNDRSGFVGGDRLLSTLARLLRAADLQSVPYRLGGDEFALTFPGMPAPVARLRMEHVRAAVEAQLGGTTVSIGLSTTTAAQPDVLIVREQANAALDEAKRRGRNCVVAFDEIRAEHPMFQPARVEAVRELIRSATVDVFFQPIWNIDDGSLIGYEALARAGGPAALDLRDAFGIAERIGKAHDLDRICRSAILERAATLPPNVLLFINVSPQSLDREDFDGTSLVRTVEAAGLTPDRIVLDLTARSAVRIDVMIREAARLRRLGFRLALDDTGAGLSSLEILSRLVVDYVKIDRDVIVGAQAGRGGRGILAGIVAIARETGAMIIAEGIETPAMLDVVRGATRSSPLHTAAQGYYLGRPQPGFADPGTVREEDIAWNARIA